MSEAHGFELIRNHASSFPLPSPSPNLILFARIRIYEKIYEKSTPPNHLLFPSDLRLKDGQAYILPQRYILTIRITEHLPNAFAM